MITSLRIDPNLMVRKRLELRLFCGFLDRVSLEISIDQRTQDIGFLDPKRLMWDTTPQEANNPYTNEVGLISVFVDKKKIVKKDWQSLQYIQKELDQIFHNFNPKRVTPTQELKRHLEAHLTTRV